MHSRVLALLAFTAATAALRADTPAPGVTPGTVAATDPAYRLASGDRIIVDIFGEGDLSAQQIIDREGRVRLPLLGPLDVAGRTVREAEHLVEEAYQQQEILRQPQVSLAVANYAPREVTLLGAVRSPGTFQFPPDVTSLDIRDVIARQGGFTPVAKGDAVAVTRRQADGREVILTVNVARMMSARSRDAGDRFLVLPGDRLFIPERLF